MLCNKTIDSDVQYVRFVWVTIQWLLCLTNSMTDSFRIDSAAVRGWLGLISGQTYSEVK